MKLVYSLKITILLVPLFFNEAWSHGRLLEPPSRSSLWRFPEFQHLSPPKNYNDNGVNCGGFAFQHYSMGGRCGECGDAFSDPKPRAHEGGGIYGRGIITRNYTAGEIIEIFVELTANHMGYFEFKLCPHNSPNTPAYQECFDQNVLVLENGSGTKYSVGPGSIFKFKIKLPEDLRCSQCILQWHYSAANNWGLCENRARGAVGCGPQETFRACADISIH